MLVASLGELFLLAMPSWSFLPRYEIPVRRAGTLEEVFRADPRIRLDEYPLDGVNCPYVSAVEDFEFSIRGERGFEISVNDQEPFQTPFSQVQVEPGDVITIQVKYCE
jgi:hypothetical protein